MGFDSPLHMIASKDQVPSPLLCKPTQALSERPNGSKSWHLSMGSDGH